MGKINKFSIWIMAFQLVKHSQRRIFSRQINISRMKIMIRWLNRVVIHRQRSTSSWKYYVDTIFARNWGNSVGKCSIEIDTYFIMETVLLNDNNSNATVSTFTQLSASTSKQFHFLKNQWAYQPNFIWFNSNAVNLNRNWNENPDVKNVVYNIYIFFHMINECDSQHSVCYDHVRVFESMSQTIAVYWSFLVCTASTRSRAQ